MGGQDQHRMGGSVVEASASDGPDTSSRAHRLLRSSSSGLGRRPWLTLTVAGVLALLAIAAVVAMTWHASAGRDAEDRLDDVIVNVNALQTQPWRLQASLLTSAPLPTGVVEREMADVHADITRTLAELARTSPVAELSQVGAPLADNYGVLVRMVVATDHAQGNIAAGLAPIAFRTHDEVLSALQKAGLAYRHRADATLWEATIGTIVVMILLLGGFVFFYWRLITARRSAETLTSELELSRRHLEHAQRIAGLGSWEWDDRNKIVRWSPEQARLHGWTQPDPPPSPRAFLELVAQDDRPRVSNAMHQAFREGKTIELEYRVAESRGGRLLHVHATNTVEADGRRHLVGTSQDMTERFRRAEAERANRAKNAFISRMSHELRTPLNAVLGFGQLMSMSDLDERQRGNVEHILSAGRHLLDLINEILDISRIESGDMRLSVEPVNLDNVLVDAVDLITPVAAEHHIALDVDQEPDLWVRGDVQRLRQVLLNLLSNAIKYNADGGHVWVRTRKDNGDGNHVRIDVQDDGAGIAPAMMERVFSPFERLGAEQSAVEGTGLGLALSRGMIEAMGGRISVRSTHGEGSTFTIELSAASAPTAAENPTPPTAAEIPTPPVVAEMTTVRAAPAAARGRMANDAGKPPAPFRLLCIEDNAANVELIEQILADRPEVRLLSAPDGDNGLRLARDEHPDLVLLDLDLPDMTGEEVLRKLQADSATARIPIVILSARTVDEQAERLLALGARSYISKPPGVTALLQAVDGAASSDATGLPDLPDRERSLA